MNDRASPDEPPSAGTRRYLTLLFADLVGSTRLGGAMEAEDFAELIGALRRLCREIIPRHGGHIARLQGDGVLALFGIPDAREDDGRRATEAALDLHAAIAALDSRAGERLALHSGIHAGLVYVQDGDVERGRFELLGDVPNVAARLSALAGADEIVVSEESLGPASHFFDTSARELAGVKGHASRLAVRRILGRSAVRRRFDASALRGSAPFTGRRAESEQVAAALREAGLGAPVCLSINGGPGIGKTRLLEEAMRDARQRGWTVLRGYCENYLGATPLQPFVQMLRSLLDGDAPAPDAADPGASPGAIARALDAVAPGPEGPAAARASPVDAVCALFDELAAHRRLLVVLDDWQWSDHVSQQALDALMALHRPLLVLAAMRDDLGDVPRVAGRSLVLSPLRMEEATETISFLLPDADPFLVAEVHRYAGGNPLFIEELCHAARAAGGASHALGPQRGGTAWLHALIESRVARLDAAQTAVVRTAAVLGNVFPDWLLTQLTGHGPDDPLVRSLAERDLIFPAERAGMLRFKHGITRDVVYATVGRDARQALHRQIATALMHEAPHAAADDTLELLAYHCAAGGLPAEAAHHAELAGDKALAAHALDRARTQYSAALHALDATGPTTDDQRRHWCAIAQKLGMACVFDALALAGSLALFERALALADETGDLAARARAEYWLCYIHYTKGNPRAAIRHGRSALARCELLGDAKLTTQVRATLGQSLASASQYDEALPLLESAIDTKRSRARIGGNVAVGSAYALACKGAVLGDRGFFSQADECFGEALALLGPSAHQVGSSVRNWISAVYLWQGRWHDALATAADSVRVAELVKSRQLLAMSRGIWGYASWVISREPRDLQAVREAAAWVSRRDGALLSSLSDGWLADGAMALGREREARQSAARALLKSRTGDPFGVPISCRALAQAAAAARRHERADRYLDQAMRSARTRGAAHEVAVTQLCRASIDIERSRFGAARESLDAACRKFESMGMAWHRARADELQRLL